MKQYEVEYRRASDFSDLIDIRIIKLDICDGYGIVSEYFGFKHPDGTINTYPSYISNCWYCNSVICSIERAKRIYQSEKDMYDRLNNICNDS